MTRLVQYSIALFLLIGAFAVACGSADGEKTTAAEEYAAALCGALAAYTDELNEASAELLAIVEDLDEESFDQFGQVFVRVGPLYVDLAEDLDTIEPPDDIVDQHASLTAAVRAAGDFFNGFGDILEMPLAEAAERVAGFDEQLGPIMQGLAALGNPGPEYTAAFDNEPVCREVDPTFDGFLRLRTVVGLVPSLPP